MRRAPVSPPFPYTTLFRSRRLPDELVATLAAAGLLRAGAPIEVEALELPPATALGCAEEVARGDASARSEEHTSELQSRRDLVCRLLLEKKTKYQQQIYQY